MTEHQHATYDDLEDEDRRLLESYTAMGMEELKAIQPVWITEQNKQDAQQIDFDHYEIIEVETEKLRKNLVLPDLDWNNLFNDHINDYRYITTLERWKNGLPVDTPTISINHSAKLTVIDGRHRMVLNSFLGHTTTPIAVQKNLRDEILQLLG